MVAIMAMVSLFSCEKEANGEEPIGGWEKMKWEKVSYTTENFQGATYYKVPKEGGTYTFKCTNYPAFIINGVMVVDLGYGTNNQTYYFPQEDDPHKLECEAVTVNVENQVVTVTIAPQSENPSRIITLTVTYGSVSGSFSFIQEF